MEQHAHNLAMHLVSVHKNAAALGNDEVENARQHFHEHYGPGGLREHSYIDVSYNEAEVKRVLAKAREADG